MELRRLAQQPKAVGLPPPLNDQPRVAAEIVEELDGYRLKLTE
jgi:hypothetical protein